MCDGKSNFCEASASVEAAVVDYKNDGMNFSADSDAESQDLLLSHGNCNVDSIARSISQAFRMPVSLTAFMLQNLLYMNSLIQHRVYIKLNFCIC